MRQKCADGKPESISRPKIRKIGHETQKRTSNNAAPNDKGAQEMTKDSSLTYLTPREFNAIGERIAGPNWQRVVAKIVDYSPQHIGLYAAGQRPIPRHVAALMHAIDDNLAQGIPVHIIEPVGRVAQGRFEPLAKSQAAKSA
jgi:hypothetical protein